MYNILIADDEKIIRIGMRSIIDWESQGFHIVDIVGDGLQALKVIQEQTIDVVITDIKMPNLDGVQLVKQLKEEGFEGEIIMLTSYGEFDLARECLRYGVHDYILKGTLRSSELIQSLEGVKPKLKGRKPVQNIPPEEVNEGEEACIHKLAQNALSGQQGDIEKVVFSKAYQLLLIKQVKSKYEQTLQKSRQFEDYRGAIQNIIAEVFPKKVKSLLTFEGEWCVYSLSGASDMTTRELHQASLQIQNLIKLYTNTRVISVMGRQLYTSYDVEDSIKKCMQVAGLAFYKGYQEILKEDAISCIKNYKVSENEKYHQVVYEAMRKGQYTETIKALECIINEIKEGCVVQEEVEALLNTIVQRIALEYGIYMEKDKVQFEAVIDKYRKATLLEEFHAAINELIFMLSTALQQVKEKHYRKEIVDIMQYIEEHMGEKITLASIAGKVNMNESYISRLFKNETGMNIINYINIRKMEKAKELLCEKNMIVKDVAYALGFEEQSYFNRTFNKYFGVNPREYKKCATSTQGKKE